jgi:DNA-binding transcriptional ArsR family regulator
VSNAPALVNTQLTAVGHPVRRAILDLTMNGERSAGEIADAFRISRPAVSQHIRVLVHARLLRERRDAQRRLYSIDVAALERFRQAFDGLWDPGLLRLKRAAESEAASRATRGRKRG